jgi:serine/threonine protein kinase
MLSTSSPKEALEKEFAIKEIPNEILLKKLGPRGPEALKKEIEISAILKHKNIVRLFDTVKTANNNYLVQEFCGGGDLKIFLT